MLDRFERTVDVRAEHFSIPFAACQTVAMFATERAAEFQHQIGYFLRDAAHQGYLRTIFEVQEWADMEATDTGMPVKRAVRAVAAQQLPEAGNKLRQALRCDGRIFHKGYRFAVAAQAVE